uniref:Uncharacterized protein n=1 Tax=Auxenochlorella protothecoides TaxID=3075 RepID=A0A1D2AH55_AUXPR
MPNMQDINALRIELAESVTTLPAALQSEFPDLFVDWLASVFPLESLAAPAGKACQASAKVLARTQNPSRGPLPCAANARRAMPSPPPLHSADLQRGAQRCRGAGNLDLVACSRCNKVLMRAAADAHAATCRASGGVLSRPAPPPRGGKRSRSQSFEPTPFAAVRASPPAPSKDPLDEQPGSPLLVPPKHARGKRSVTPQRKRQYRVAVPAGGMALNPAPPPAQARAAPVGRRAPAHLAAPGPSAAPLPLPPPDPVQRPRVPAVDAAPQAALMRPEAQYQQHQARYQGQAVAVQPRPAGPGSASQPGSSGPAPPPRPPGVGGDHDTAGAPPAPDPRPLQMLADLTPAQRQQLLLHHAILMQRQRQVALQAQQAGLPGQRGSLPAQGPLRLQPTGPRQTAQAQAQQAQQQRHAAQLFAAQQARMFAPGQAPAVVSGRPLPGPHPVRQGSSTLPPAASAPLPPAGGPGWAPVQRPGAGGCAPHAFLGFQTPYGAAAAYGAGPLPQHAYPQQAYPPPQHLRGQVRPADPAPSVPAAALSYGDLIRRCSPTPELSGTPSLPNGASPHASGGGAAEAASPFLPSTGDWSLPHFSHASPSLTQLLRGGSGAQQSQGPLVFVPDISPGAG